MSALAKGKVFFIGAGPGDPDLITVKAKNLLAQADLILYAGSLVSREILSYAKDGAEIHDTARMKLDEQVARMSQAAHEGKLVLRLHTGDPSIYGALDEQMRALRDRRVPFEVVPGVSSVFAAAAALQLEFTLPEITQTLILTRIEGRTPVPELENLHGLAAHQSSLAIFLSTSMIGKVVGQLIEAGYDEDSPIAVVYRASWPDQAVVRGTLRDIEQKLQAQELTHQGMIIVSPALGEDRKSLSHLYGGYQAPPSLKKGVAIYALTKPAVTLGKKLLEGLEGARLFVPPAFEEETKANLQIEVYPHGIRDALQTGFQRYSTLICIMASGIVVRELAPVISNKHQDPAVLVLDAQGRFVISLLSGHEGGANAMAHQVAQLTGGEAVITTASDSQGVPALDVLVKHLGWKLDLQSDLAGVMGAFVNQEEVTLSVENGLDVPDVFQQLPWKEKRMLMDGLPTKAQKEVVISYHKLTPPRAGKLGIHPPVLCVGVGCNRGTPETEVFEAIVETFTRHRLALESIACLASVNHKADEAGLLQLAEKQNWPIHFYSPDEILKVEAYIKPSQAPQKAIGVPGVAEPCALLAANTTELLVTKEKYPNVTVAVALVDLKRESV